MNSSAVNAIDDVRHLKDSCKLLIRKNSSLRPIASVEAVLVRPWPEGGSVVLQAAQQVAEASLGDAVLDLGAVHHHLRWPGGGKESKGMAGVVEGGALHGH